MHEYTIAGCGQREFTIGKRRRLTNDHEVDILGEQLAPLHASQSNVAVVFLAWCPVEKPVVEDEREDIGVIEQIVRGASEALYDEVGEVGVGGARQALCQQLRYLIGVLRDLRNNRCSTGG